MESKDIEQKLNILRYLYTVFYDFIIRIENSCM